MGVSYLEKEYPTPYHSKVPLYEIPSGQPNAGQPLHYASSATDRDSTQPFKTVPWTVEFKGCCRQFEGISSQDPKPDSVVNFAIRTTVDLSNHVASPRIVSMPFIYTLSQRQMKIPICALSTGGKEAMVRKNGGTINYPDDDNQTATFSWKVKGYSAAMSEASSNGRCVVLTLGQSPTYQFGETDAITIEVKMGDVEVTGDYFVHAPTDFASVADQQSARAPFGCPIGSVCEAEFSLGKSTPFFTGSPALFDFASSSTPQSPLEIRYVIATGSHQSTLLSTSQGTVQYSLTEIGEDHAGLPEGARMAPVLTSAGNDRYVTSLDVWFSADERNTRPLVNQAISNEQRDYTVHRTAGSGWHLVAGRVAGGATFDDSAGGAHVSVYMEKAMQNANDLSDHRHMAAITGVELATPGEVAGWEDKGYQKLDRDGRSNLLEQSDRGQIYIMFKRGSGPPVTDVSSTARPGYTKITATTSHEALGNLATRSLWIKYSMETRVSRSFLWEPCTGQDEEVIICANAHSWNATKNGLAPFGGAMQCILLDVVPKTPPNFMHSLEETYSATMGKELKIPLRFKRTDLPLSFTEEIPKVRFGEKGTNTQPVDSDRVKGLLTGRTKIGSRITGKDGMTSELSKVTTASDATAFGESEGFLLWTPSPYQGGWKGEVCLDACIDTSTCPEKIGGAAEVCKQTCFAVNVIRCKWALVRLTIRPSLSLRSFSCAKYFPSPQPNMDVNLCVCVRSKERIRSWR